MSASIYIGWLPERKVMFCCTHEMIIGINSLNVHHKQTVNKVYDHLDKAHNALFSAEKLPNTRKFRISISICKTGSKWLQTFGWRCMIKGIMLSIEDFFYISLQKLVVTEHVISCITNQPHAGFSIHCVPPIGATPLTLQLSVGALKSPAQKSDCSQSGHRNWAKLKTLLLTAVLLNWQPHH